MRIRFLAALLAIVLPAALANAAITFTPGHLYSADYFSRDIVEYSPTGTVLGSLTLPASVGDEIHGLAFGNDGLLYATAIKDSGGFSVIGIDSSGAIHQTYTFPNAFLAGNLSYGKIALDSSNIYVAGGNQLTRFTRGDPASGKLIYTNNQVFDVDPLPNGNLLVASAYYIEEITKDGTLVRKFPDPSPQFYTDIRGVDYDPATNKVFVTHLGHSDFFDRLMRINYATGAMENNTTFLYADDIFVLGSGNLLVGSRSDNPRIYTQNFDLVATLGGTHRMFVTQMVPEPSSALALLLAIPLALRRRRPL